MSTVNQHSLQSRLIRHHSLLAAAVGISVFLFYIAHPLGDVIMRTSFATGYPALLLLAITLWIGPWNLLRRRRTPVSSDLRRDIGIWAGIMGVLHTGIGINVHLRGRPWLYFVYGRNEGSHLIPLRHDLFGFANYTGLIATIILVVLFATSNDYALRALSTPRWKQLQRWNYVLFIFAILHTAAFQKMESQRLSFVGTLIACAAVTLVLQGMGFQRRRSHTKLKQQATAAEIFYES